jgi:hypothetical protein
VGARPITKLEPGLAPEPSLKELAQRADTLETDSPTGSLQSTRTVLTALLLSATEALEHLSGESRADRSPAFEHSIAAIGAYLIHACNLEHLPLGRLIAARFDEDEAEAAVPRYRSKRAER